MSNQPAHSDRLADLSGAGTRFKRLLHIGSETRPAVRGDRGSDRNQPGNAFFDLHEYLSFPTHLTMGRAERIHVALLEPVFGLAVLPEFLEKHGPPPLEPDLHRVEAEAENVRDLAIGQLFEIA